MTKQKKSTGGEAAFLTSTAQMIGSTLGGLVAKAGLAHADAAKTTVKAVKRAAKKTAAKKHVTKKHVTKKAAAAAKRTSATRRTPARSK